MKTLPVAVLLGILPGLGHVYCGYRRRARWLAGSAATLLVLLVLTLRLDITGLLAFCLYLVLAASFVDAYFCARSANGDPEAMGWRWLALASVLLTLHLIGLAIVLHPFPIVTVRSPALDPPFDTGTRFLAARYHGDPRRGDYVLYDRDYGPLIDRILALPGDRVACGDGRLRVNGELLPPGYIPGRQPRRDAAIEVPPRHWLVYYHEPRRGLLTDSLTDDFVLLTDDEIAGVILAVYAPAERRRWL